MSWGQERAENILRPCWTKHLRSSVYSASSFQDALVLLSNLRFSQKTITHPTFHFCILVYVLLQSGIVKITRNERVHNVLLLICWLALDPLWVLRFLGCWSMSDDCVDQGSFMCSQLKSENNFFLIVIAEWQSWNHHAKHCQEDYLLFCMVRPKEWFFFSPSLHSFM